MYFISKDGKEVKDLLSEDEESFLKKKSDLSHVQKTSLLEKLSSLKEDFYIRCDCHQDLVICKREAILYTRSKSIISHQRGCDFYDEKHVSDFEKKRTSLLCREDVNFAFYTKPRKLSKSVSEKTSSGKEKTSRLGAALYECFEDQGLSSLCLSKPRLSLSQQLTLVKEHFLSPCRKIHKSLHLKDFFRYVFSQERLTKAEPFLQWQREVWPSYLEPFVMFSGIARDADETSLEILQGKSLYENFSLSNPLKRPSGWINYGLSAPYFVLVTAVLDKDGKIYLKDGFGMPLLSETELFPVESDYERRALKKILKVCRQFPHVEVTIKKPLFCSKSKDDKYFRPDFVLTLPQGLSVIIEVLGFETESYLAQKREMVLLFREEYGYCRVFPVKAYQGAQAFTDLETQLRSLFQKY